jgi:hypothetical protein
VANKKVELADEEREVERRARRAVEGELEVRTKKAELVEKELSLADQRHEMHMETAYEQKEALEEAEIEAKVRNQKLAWMTDNKWYLKCTQLKAELQEVREELELQRTRSHDDIVQQQQLHGPKTVLDATKKITNCCRHLALQVWPVLWRFSLRIAATISVVIILFFCVVAYHLIKAIT